MIKERQYQQKQKVEEPTSSIIKLKMNAILPDKKQKFSESPNMQKMKQNYQHKLANSARKRSQQNLLRQYTYRYSPALETKNTINLASERKSFRYGQNVSKQKLKLPDINRKISESPNARQRQLNKKNIKKYSYDFTLQDEIQNLNLKKYQSIKTSKKQYAVSVRTKAGCNGKIIKINQDLDIVCQKLPKGLKLFCICDGHGVNGHHVVAFIRKKLIENLKNNLANVQDMEYLQQQIYLTMMKTNTQLLESNINTELSGSTVVAVFIHQQKIMCYNVGDSRAILLNYEDEIWRTHQLSIDQKPDRKDEAKRILASGGRIEQQLNDKQQPVGPLRVWMKQIQSPGLAMTRSFGDKAGNKAGTTAQPQLTEYSITPQTKYLFIASDGIWQHIQNHEIPKFIGKQLEKQQMEEACDRLMDKAVEVWDQVCMSRDDITFLLVRIGDMG